EPYALQQRGNRALTVIGRLAPGATLAQATTEIHRTAEDSQPGSSAAIVPLDEYLSGGVRLTVFVVWGAVAILLLVSGANTATLLLARAGRRRHEIGVLVALGATRGRIVRTLLIESVLLALAAGVLGLGFSFTGTSLFVALAPPAFPRLYDVGVNVRVFVFALATALLTGVAFG